MAANKIGFYTATALVVANMIGTGVFTSLGFETAALPSVPVLMLLWLVGGLIALCGGLSYISLARLLPGSGGEYHYVKQAYPPFLARIAGTISIVAGFSAPVALAGMAFAVYFSQLVPKVPVKMAALLLVTIVTVFHCFTLKLSSRFQLVGTGLKLLLILVFIFAGLLYSGSHLEFSFSPSQYKMLASPGFASSLVYVSFAYSGWNASTYIFNEIKNPLKNIQHSVIYGTLLVTLLYLLLNLVFLKVLPLAQIHGVVEIAALAASAIFGVAGGKMAAIVISLLLISTVSAMVWVGPRVIVKMAEGSRLQLFKSAPLKVPVPAVLFQYAITAILLLTSTFELVLTYTVICLNLCSCLAVSVLFLNYKSQSLKTLLLAAVFIAASLWSCVFLVLLRL